MLRNESQQKPLFHIIHEDDIELLNTADAEWFHVLYNFRWKRCREFGARYYDALYEFNQRQAREREERIDSQAEEVLETKEEAMQRLLFSRVTMQAKSKMQNAVLYEGEVVVT